MKGPLLCIVALCGLLAYLVVFFGTFSLVGIVLSLIYTYTIQLVWPSLPDILWWQFGLVVFGINMLRNTTITVVKQ